MKKCFCIVGMVLGLLIVALGLYLAFGNSLNFRGAKTEDAVFGLDYYSYQYDATQHAANNVKELGDYMSDTVELLLNVVGLIVSVFGGVIICYFGYKLDEIKNTPVVVSTVPHNMKE